jgi:hypothetical protein
MDPDLSDFSAMAAAPRGFPVDSGRGHQMMLPWKMMEPHSRQALENHGQSLAELSSRGGLSWCEACAVIEDRAWKPMLEADAKLRVMTLVGEWNALGNPPSKLDPAIEAGAIALFREHFGDTMAWASASVRLKAIWRNKTALAIAAWSSVKNQAPETVVTVTDAGVFVKNL